MGTSEGGVLESFAYSLSRIVLDKDGKDFILGVAVLVRDLERAVVVHLVHGSGIVPVVREHALVDVVGRGPYLFVDGGEVPCLDLFARFVFNGGNGADRWLRIGASEIGQFAPTLLLLFLGAVLGTVLGRVGQHGWDAIGVGRVTGSGGSAAGPGHPAEGGGDVETMRVAQ